MRLIAGISFVLLGVGTLLCEVECQSAAAVTGSSAAALVRTTDGWESPHAWRVDAATAPRVHPLVVAAGQGLLSIFALVACQREKAV